MKGFAVLLSVITYTGVPCLVHGQSTDFLSVWNLGGAFSDAGAGIDVDPDGDVVITGFFRETVDFGGVQLTSAGIDDSFVARFDDGGNLVWAAAGGSTGADEGRGVAADAAGNTIATGRFFGTATFGSSEVVGSGSWDAYLAKYEAGGTLAWIEAIGGSGIDEGFDVAFDPSGNAFVTGSFSGDATVGDSVFTSYGQEDIFLAKFDVDGNFIWANRAGGQFFDAGHGIATDSQGNVFVSGRFSSSSTFADTVITSNRLFNGYLARYDADGSFRWVRKVGGRDDFSYGVDVDGLGNPVIVGYFQENGDFEGVLLTSFGSADIYVAKFDPDGVPIWVNQAGSGDTDMGYAVAADDDGNVLITGFFVGTATFGDMTIESSAFKDVFRPVRRRR